MCHNYLSIQLVSARGFPKSTIDIDALGLSRFSGTLMSGVDALATRLWVRNMRVYPVERMVGMLHQLAIKAHSWDNAT